MIHEEFGLLPEKLGLPKTITIPAFSIDVNNALEFMGVYYGGTIFQPKQVGQIEYEFQKDNNVSICIILDGTEYPVIDLTLDEFNQIKLAMNDWTSPIKIIINSMSVKQPLWNPLVIRSEPDQKVYATRINVDFFSRTEIPRKLQHE